MAKRKTTKSRKAIGGRDVKIIARPLPRLSQVNFPHLNPYSSVAATLNALADFDTRRSPMRHRNLLAPSPMLLSGWRAPVRNRVLKNLSLSRTFETPQSTAVCVRRKTRKEVLFAKRRTSKGSKSTRRRRNSSSSISC